MNIIDIFGIVVDLLGLFQDVSELAHEDKITPWIFVVGLNPDRASNKQKKEPS